MFLYEMWLARLHTELLTTMCARKWQYLDILVVTTLEVFVFKVLVPLATAVMFFDDYYAVLAPVWAYGTVQLWQSLKFIASFRGELVGISIF